MKRFLLALTMSALVCSAAYPTEQMPDRLIIGEETFFLSSFPLYSLFETLKSAKAPFMYGDYPYPHTACYRGYLATWRVIDGLLMLTEVKKCDGSDTRLNIVEYLESNGYNPVVIDGFVFADWYSDYLVTDVYFTYINHRNWFYLISDLKQKRQKPKLVFKNGKLIEKNIVPIETYAIGDTLCTAEASQSGLEELIGIVRENNGKLVRLEVVFYGRNNEPLTPERQKVVIKDPDNFWVNPRYYKNLSHP